MSPLISGCAVVAVTAAVSACARVIIAPHVEAQPQAEASELRFAPPPAAPPVASETYHVTIAMTADTAEALAASGFALMGFKAVGATDKAGVPLVWFRATHYSLSTAVTWHSRYQAYTATHATGSSASIDAMASYDIASGQVLEVQHPTGTGVVRLGGTPGAISFHNQTTTLFTCGISQYQAGVAAPIASFPLHGKSLQVAVPMERVLLVFATVLLEPGTPVRTSPGLGVLLDLGDAHERSVTYDINAGWRWGGHPWAQEVPPDADIVPLLIVSLPR